MKEKELIRQMKRIQLHVEKSQIVPRAMGIAGKYGAHSSEEHSAHTKFEDKFSGKDYRGKTLDIKHSGGWTDFGGEDLEINYERQRVFYVSTMSLNIAPRYLGDARAENVPQVKIGELYLHNYSPGAWEKQLALIYKNGPKPERKKKEIVIEKDVEQSKLEELAERLPIKL